MKIPLQTAREFAEEIVQRMERQVERIEIAGSIRRRRPVVGDFDLVIQLKPETPIFIKEANDQADTYRLGGFLCRPLNHGKNYRVLETIEGRLQIDIWLATPRISDLLEQTPGNFGTLLLCRTGSKEHNIYIANRAKSMGLRWKSSKGILDKEGNIIASETEEDVFRALGLDYIEPEAREWSHD